MRCIKLFFAAVCCVAGVSACSASAAVIGITVADASSGDYNLTSVTVSRAGAGVFTYLPTQLSGIALTDVFAVGIPLVVSRGAPLPPEGTRASLIEDMRLDTGVVNPASDGAPQDQSFEITFARPVVNDAGEDVLIFDLGSGDATRFWISGTDRDSSSIVLSSFSAALLSSMPYSTYSYNGGNIDDLDELESAPASSFGARQDSAANIVAAGLDLSLLGVPLGGTVSALRFQADTTSARLDPMLIVGLPAIPEPSGVAVVIMLGLGLLRRRRDLTAS